MSPEELKVLLQEGNVQLVDVREPIENAEEKIPDSLLMPLSSFDPAKVLVIKKDKKLVLHCRSGKRSMQAAQKLLEIGCVEVYSLAGGIEAWKAKGYDVMKSQNAPISLMRQVQIVAGGLVLLGAVLAQFVSPNYIYLSGFVGAGLLFAGLTNTCALGMLLSKMPWNQISTPDNSCSIGGK